MKDIKQKALTLFLIAMFGLGSTFLLAQEVLFDDVNNHHPGRTEWSYLLDTLSSYATVHYVADEGWSNIMDMDMVWIFSPHYSYDTATKLLMQDYVRGGGVIFIGDLSQTGYSALNNLLLDTGWETTMAIVPSGQYLTWSCVLELAPLTNGIVTTHHSSARIISCGENSFALALGNCIDSKPVVAISYPFSSVDNCSSFVLLFTGAHSWENECMIRSEHFRLAKNILFCAAGLPGYELEPCATPEIPDDFYGHGCLRYPNPFTPNNDAINDFIQFAFDNIGQSEGTIYIYNIHGHEVKQIPIPTGAGAKEAAQWDGCDNNGNDLPQGLYVYIIESGGEIVCEGTTVIAR